jgi:uncharacterized protein (TIGR03067 family)
MRSYLWFINAILLLASYGCDSGALQKDDLGRLQGTWELFSAEQGGVDVTKDCQKEGFRIEFKGDAWIQDTGPYHFYTAENSHIKLNPSKSPKEFDHVHSSIGPGKAFSFVYPGIYELDGEMLKICFDVDAKSRPTALNAKSSSGYFSAVLKRVK